MRLGNMDRGAGGNLRITGSNSGRSRKLKGSMASWKSSSEAIIIDQKDKRELRAQTS